MIKERIETEINKILQGNYNFGIYIAMKDGDLRLKKLVLHEGEPGEESSLQERIQNRVVDTICRKFLSEESQYEPEEVPADAQNRFFVVNQKQEKAPFAYLAVSDEEIENFSLDTNDMDMGNADAVLFQFSKPLDGRNVALWAYQKVQSSVNFSDKGTQAVDLLILGDEIIMDSHGFMVLHDHPVSSGVRVDLFAGTGIVELCQNSDAGFYRRGLAYSYRI